MQMVQEVVTRVGFGLFEADLQTAELWKAGRRIKLQSQPFKVLTALLEKPGEVVTREELHLRLWGPNAVGDFDHSLGTAVNKIREALGDMADNPRFVETLARRGYRWIAPVSVLASQPLRAEPGEIAETDKDVAVPGEGDGQGSLPGSPMPPAHVIAQVAQAEEARVSAAFRKWRPTSRSVTAICLAAILIAIAGCWVGWLVAGGSHPRALLQRIEQVTRNGRIAPGMAGMENLPAAVTDGLRVYVPVLAEGETTMSAVDVHTGAVQPLDVPNAIQSPALGDLSPDGSTLLMRSHLSPESELPFWTVPTGGGSALQLANVVGHDATWMPDGKSVLYASGNQLFLQRLAEGTSTLFANLPGRAFWLRWSPDGTLLRFTLLDPVGHTLQLAEIGSDGKGFRTILRGWTTPSAECCGVWTGDGRYFVFQSTRAGERDSGTDLWRLQGKRVTDPIRVTDGPMNYVAPVAPRIGQRIYFLGMEQESALRVYDAATRRFAPAPAFLASAARVQYSRDNKWVTWTDMSGHQWRAHADGAETVQLTPDSMQVFLGQWSPDEHRVALMARQPGKAWQIYVVNADGGSPRLALSESRNAADPSWSPDGQHIVFGRVTDVMGKEAGPRALEILDLQTNRTTTVTGSDGFFSPRWSPDGRYIAALSLDQLRLMLYDTVSGQWSTLAATTAADPVWAADSESIFIHAALAPGQPIYRVSIHGGSLEKIADSTSFAGGTTADYFFCGLTPAGAPIVRTRTATGNLYTLDLDGH